VEGEAQQSGAGDAVRDNLIWAPLDLVRFVGAEYENFLVSLANHRNDLAIINRLQGLYAAAMSHKTIKGNDVVLYQLLTFIHYHFLFSTSNLMKLHLSEAFASLRAAIDAALIAAQIVHDRASQLAYAKREKPFDKLSRHFRNLIRDKKPLPHRHIPVLLNVHELCSRFASHADIDSFIHRARISPDGDAEILRVDYFQFARDPDERQMHALRLFHTFLTILDVYADFLVVEVGSVPEAWRKELHALGSTMEQHSAALSARAAAKNIEQGEGGQ
jgi:hypothetical protein